MVVLLVLIINLIGGNFFFQPNKPMDSMGHFGNSTHQNQSVDAWNQKITPDILSQPNIIHPSSTSHSSPSDRIIDSFKTNDHIDFFGRAHPATRNEETGGSAVHNVQDKGQNIMTDLLREGHTSAFHVVNSSQRSKEQFHNTNVLGYNENENKRETFDMSSSPPKAQNLQPTLNYPPSGQVDQLFSSAERYTEDEASLIVDPRSLENQELDSGEVPNVSQSISLEHHARLDFPHSKDQLHERQVSRSSEESLNERQAQAFFGQHASGSQKRHMHGRHGMPSNTESDQHQYKISNINERHSSTEQASFGFSGEQLKGSEFHPLFESSPSHKKLLDGPPVGMPVIKHADLGTPHIDDLVGGHKQMYNTVKEASNEIISQQNKQTLETYQTSEPLKSMESKKDHNVHQGLGISVFSYESTDRNMSSDFLPKDDVKNKELYIPNEFTSKQGTSEKQKSQLFGPVPQDVKLSSEQLVTVPSLQREPQSGAFPEINPGINSESVQHTVPGNELLGANKANMMLQQSLLGAQQVSDGSDLQLFKEKEIQPEQQKAFMYQQEDNKLLKEQEQRRYVDAQPYEKQASQQSLESTQVQSHLKEVDNSLSQPYNKNQQSYPGHNSQDDPFTPTREKVYPSQQQQPPHEQQPQLQQQQYQQHQQDQAEKRWQEQQQHQEQQQQQQQQWRQQQLQQQQKQQQNELVHHPQDISYQQQPQQLEGIQQKAQQQQPSLLQQPRNVQEYDQQKSQPQLQQTNLLSQQQPQLQQQNLQSQQQPQMQQESHHLQQYQQLPQQQPQQYKPNQESYQQQKLPQTREHQMLQQTERYQFQPEQQPQQQPLQQQPPEQHQQSKPQQQFQHQHYQANQQSQQQQFQTQQQPQQHQYQQQQQQQQ